MFRLALLIHIMLMTVIMGGFVIVIVSVPWLYDNGMRLIPLAALVGFVVALPLSRLVARRILEATKAD